MGYKLIVVLGTEVPLQSNYCSHGLPVSSIKHHVKYNTMSQRFTVTRTVLSKQAIVLKASSEANAIELSRKTKFVDWASDNTQRNGYNAVAFEG